MAVNNRFSTLLATSIVAGISRGLPLASACAKARVPKKLVEKWLLRGAALNPDGEPTFPEYAQFLADFQYEEAAFEEGLVQSVNEAGQVDYKAAIALLERRFPSRWALKQVVQQSVLDAEREQLLTVIEQQLGTDAYMTVLDYLSSDQTVPPVIIQQIERGK